VSFYATSEPEVPVCSKCQRPDCDLQLQTIKGLQAWAAAYCRCRFMASRIPAVRL
jgi:hypothetical protein